MERYGVDIVLIAIPHAPPSILSSNNLHPCTFAGRRGQAAVPGEERRIENLRERDIGRIIGGEIASERPNPWQQQVVGVPAQGQIGQIG